eukprot:975132-Pelagomonas_calceolata.AAC.4
MTLLPPEASVMKRFVSAQTGNLCNSQGKVAAGHDKKIGSSFRGPLRSGRAGAHNLLVTVPQSEARKEPDLSNFFPSLQPPSAYRGSMHSV